MSSDDENAPRARRASARHESSDERWEGAPETDPPVQWTYVVPATLLPMVGLVIWLSSTASQIR